jgi:siroheme synthase (precorrin-2 oxidase/ferrochelatase)
MEYQRRVLIKGKFDEIGAGRKNSRKAPGFVAEETGVLIFSLKFIPHSKKSKREFKRLFTLKRGMRDEQCTETVALARFVVYWTVNTAVQIAVARLDGTRFGHFRMSSPTAFGAINHGRTVNILL